MHLENCGVAALLVCASGVVMLGCYPCTEEMAFCINADTLGSPTQPRGGGGPEDAAPDTVTGPPTTLTYGSTGRIEVAPDFIGGVFFADDRILRAAAHPECVVHLESAEKAFTRAGTLTVSSELVGMPGGPPLPIVINPDARKEYWAFPDLALYNFPDGTNVQIQLAGTSVMPALPVTTLRSPIYGTIDVTEPVPPGEGVLQISSSAPLTVQWNVPTTDGGPDAAAQRLTLRLFALSPVRWAQLYCSWPLSAGQGAVPAVLLSELREQLEWAGALDSVVDLFTGEFAEVTTATSSYVLYVTPEVATTFPRSFSAQFN